MVGVVLVATGRRPMAAALVAVVVVFDVVVGVRAGVAVPADFAVYRMGAAALTYGQPLYAVTEPGSGLGFTYPVFAALVFLPLAVLPAPVAFAGVLVLNTALLVGLCALLVRHTGLPTVVTVALVPLALLSAPVASTFALGQVNLVVVALVLADLLVLEGRSGQGVGIGLAAGFKVAPVLFLLYLAGTRRWRALVTAGAVFLGTVVVGFAARPGDAGRYWTSALFDTGRVGSQANGGNAALTALLAPVLGHDVPAAAVVSVGVVVLGVVLPLAARLDRAGRVLAGLSVCGLGGLLACPLSWSHHWIWLPVAALCLWPGHGRVVPAAVAVVAVVDLRWLLVEAEQHGLDGLQPLSAGLFAALAVALIAALILRLSRPSLRLPRPSHGPASCAAVRGRPAAALRAPGAPARP